MRAIDLVCTRQEHCMRPYLGNHFYAHLRLPERPERQRNANVKHANLVHPQQQRAHIGRVQHAVAVHVANAKHGFQANHVEQDRHVAFVNHAVQIKVAGAQLPNVGHAVVIQVNGLRERGVVGLVRLCRRPS